VRYTPPGGTDQFITNDLLNFAGLTATNNVLLQTSSTIDPLGGTAAFGALTTAPTRVLTGLGGSITFTGTTLTGATGGVYEFNKSGAGVLSLGAINSAAAGTNPTTIRKSGNGTLLLGIPTAPQLTNATDVVDIVGGQVTAVTGGGLSPLGQATVQLSSGGALAISTSDPTVTIANPINVSGTGTLSAGNFGFGALDNSTVTIGSALTISGTNTLTVNSKNGYILNLGAISGTGTLQVTGGTINANAAVNVGPIIVSGTPTLTNTYDTALNTTAPLNAASVKIEAGGVVKQTGTYATTGDTSVETNAEFQVNGGSIDSNVVLKGGILRAQTGVTNFGNRPIVANAPVPIVNEIRGVLDLTNGGLAPNNEGGILGIQLREPNKTATLTGALAIPGSPAADAAFGSLFSSTEVTAGQNFTAVFFGRLTAPENGVYQFRSGTVDDNGAFWVDLNRNGLFEAAGSAGNELLSGMGCCGDGPIGSATLVAGKTYNVAFGVEDTGGQSGYTAQFKRPSDAALINVDPSAQAGIWSRIDALTGGAVVVETGATLIAPRVSNATVVTLIGENAKLTLNSATAASDVVGGISALLGPTLAASTLQVGAQNTLTADSLTVANDATLIKTGDGTLTATTQSLGARVINPAAPALQVEAGIVNLNGTASAFNQDAIAAANTGNVVVNGGTLNVNGAISGSVLVNAAGKLGGIGTVGAATISGIIAPGNSPGILTTGTLLLNSTAKYQFELGDLIVVNGDLTLDGLLQVNVGGLQDGTYPLINYTGVLTNNTLDLDPAFLALFAGSSISTTTPNQINLIVVPEPGAFAALLGGLGLLTGLRRFRRS
jgi:hypothetical protein